MSEPDATWPVRMKDGAGDAGSALRQYDHETADTPSEAAAYGRVLTKLERPSGRSFWLVAAGATALAVPVLLWAIRPGSPPSPNSLPIVAKAPASAVAPTSPATPARGTAVRLAALPTRLPTGSVLLDGGVTATLADGTVATARFQQGTLDIALASGAVVLHVPPRAIGQAVLITAEQLRFTVVGTVFRLSREPQRIDLSVVDGLVAVSKDGDHVATVAPGESWSVALPPAPPPAGPRRNEAAPRLARRAPPGLDCARFTGDQGPQKIACLRELARQGGLAGERAQHALARYLRDDVVDLTGALAAFESQRSRYPRGELRADADRAVIELLPRLGRHAEALVETQSFLDAHPDAEDRAEMRLLRGDMYRAIFQDVMSAEREYDEGAAADGRTGDDSRFLRALCLESLGRVDEARLAYRDYLAQAKTAHAREAQRRMQRLAR